MPIPRAFKITPVEKGMTIEGPRGIERVDTDEMADGEMRCAQGARTRMQWSGGGDGTMRYDW